MQVGLLYTATATDTRLARGDHGGLITVSATPDAATMPMPEHYKAASGSGYRDAVTGCYQVCTAGLRADVGPHVNLINAFLIKIILFLAKGFWWMVKALVVLSLGLVVMYALGTGIAQLLAECIPGWEGLRRQEGAKDGIQMQDTQPVDPNPQVAPPTQVA